MRLLLLLSSIIGVKTSSLCRVTSAINDNLDQSTDIYFTYPIDIYSPLLTSLESSSRFYICSNPENAQLTSTHNCTTDPACPIHKRNIEDARIRDDGRPCIRTRKDSINVIVFGGSATLGKNARGCCCSADIDPNCSTEASQECRASRVYDTPSNKCGWVGYLSRYLSTLHTEYIVHNLAISGHKSKKMADRALEQLTKSGIVLRDSDIILLDHSVNDAQDGYNEQEPEDEFASGLESLIRTLLTYANGARPHMILLEMHPFPDKFHITSYNSSTYTGFDYSTHYRTIGAYYNISIWSYKDVIWSEYMQKMTNNDEGFRLMQYLKFENTYIAQRTFLKVHPPWHVHLFYADLIAQLFYKKFESNCLFTSIEQQQQYRELPKPLTRMKTSTCSSLHDHLVHVDFTEPQITSPDAYEISPLGSWHHTEDRPNKFGLVSTYSDKDREGHNIKVPIDKSTLDKFSPDQELVLLLTFLRTYKNAGALAVDLCGKWVYIVDALWDSFLTKFISVPYTFPYKITVRDIHTHCRNEPEPFLVFNHFYHKSRDSEMTEARMSSQKFRIDKIVLCTCEEQETEWAE